VESTPPEDKTLLLLRHAKSAWDQDVEDHERRLDPRGQRDAEAAGRLLASRNLVPDVVACSTSVRTRETWDRAVSGGARAHEVRYLDEVYEARAADLAAVVSRMPASARTVMLVGHAPGIPDLADLLAVRREGSEAWTRRGRKYPTAGLAVLTFSGSWTALAEAGPDRAGAELVAFEVPRGDAG